jgi:hypothetical protein
MMFINIKRKLYAMAEIVKGVVFAKELLYQLVINLNNNVVFYCLANR